jgi:hypothetical protein
MAKATADIRSLARAQTALAIRTLTGVCSSKAAPAAARVSAASALLDRGWGRPQQTPSGEDGETIRVVLRTITESAPPMPSCRIPRPAGSLGGGGVVGVGHGHPHHQIVDGRDKD